MFSKILVAIDGSRSAKRVFTRYSNLASKCDSRLDVVHVVPCKFGVDSANTFDLVEGLKTKANETLEQCERVATKNNIPTRVISELGDPSKIIVEHTNSNVCDLIVMGS